MKTEPESIGKEVLQIRAPALVGQRRAVSGDREDVVAFAGQPVGRTDDLWTHDSERSENNRQHGDIDEAQAPGRRVRIGRCGGRPIALDGDSVEDLLGRLDRKSTRLNSSHSQISYA